MRCDNERERDNKQIDISFSLVLLTMNFVITFSKYSARPLDSKATLTML